jgi:hypothetical protein
MAIDKSTIERPFRFGTKGIAVASGVAARESKIQGILSIRATTPGYGVGELAWDTRRGSRLDALRNSSMTDAFEDIVIRGVEDTFDYGLPEEKLDAVGGAITDEIIVINIETVPAKERGNSHRTVTKTKFSFRRSA